MTPDVLARKLEGLGRYLGDLETHRGRTAEDIRKDPYEVERLLELVVQVALDILSHLLAEDGVTPTSYRQVFEEAGHHGILPAELASRLSDSAGLRNILVHMYDEIDYAIVAGSVDRALTDFRDLLVVLEARLER